MRNEQKLIFTNDVADALSAIVAELKPNRTIVVADENTARDCLPMLSAITDTAPVVTAAGDEAKTLDTLTGIWTGLEAAGATRQSLVVNVGGGVVTDMGGFAAATLKRGLRFVNVPTTLLGAVDAAVGGKTGINFNGLKNEVGAFAPACRVVISTRFFATLPLREIKSGFAEMIKHSMLSGDQALDRLLSYDVHHVKEHLPELLTLLEESVKVKQDIVAQDPEEHGLRRALNLGHTVGHALESLALERHAPVPHGYAVAWGLVAETVLSHLQKCFPSDTLHRLARYVSSNYGAMPITCNDYPQLVKLMQHDKKSHNGEINCTLLAGCGNIHIDQTISQDEMESALDIFRDLMGI